MARTVQRYVDNFERAPIVVLACHLRYSEPSLIEGAHIYPACQNLLLAARALGYGGVLTGFHREIEPKLRDVLHLPRTP
jgi:nitroreductase